MLLTLPVSGLTKLVDKAGLSPIRLHGLRHSHAILTLKVGVYPEVVSERLGHASITITLDIFSHVLPSLQGRLPNGSAG